MPYCTPEAKDRIDHGHPAQNVGELTYELQQVVQRFLLNACKIDECQGEGNHCYTHDRVDCPGPLSYHLLGLPLLAIEGLRADYVDRILLPYEAVKAATNGDVWDSSLIATNR